MSSSFHGDRLPPWPERCAKWACPYASGKPWILFLSVHNNHHFLEVTIEPWYSGMCCRVALCAARCASMVCGDPLEKKYTYSSGQFAKVCQVSSWVASWHIFSSELASSVPGVCALCLYRVVYCGVTGFPSIIEAWTCKYVPISVCPRLRIFFPCHFAFICPRRLS